MTLTNAGKARGLVPAKLRTVPAPQGHAPDRSGLLIMLHVIVIAGCLALPVAAALHAYASPLSSSAGVLVWSRDGLRPTPSLRRAG